MRLGSGILARTRDYTALRRLTLSLVAGLIIAAGLWAAWNVEIRISVWLTTAAVFITWTWVILGPMGAEDTAAHARREDTTHGWAGFIVVAATLVSLTSAVLLLFRHNNHALLLGTIIGVVLSWIAIHTLFAAHYARMYFAEPVGGIDFHQEEPPIYTDFAYVAITIGMSFAISDTDLSGSALRRPALAHALLSYLFGTVIVALVVNLIAGMSP